LAPYTGIAASCANQSEDEDEHVLADTPHTD
jgi:hypothetical protein